VRELLGLIKGVKTNSGLVAMSFIVCRVQPYKERAHAGYDFKGDTDTTRERAEMLSRDDVLEKATKLFAPFASFSVSGQTRPFNYTNPPPQVVVVAGRLLPLAIRSLTRPRSTLPYPASGSSHK